MQQQGQSVGAQEQASGERRGSQPGRDPNRVKDEDVQRMIDQGRRTSTQVMETVDQIKEQKEKVEGWKDQASAYGFKADMSPGAPNMMDQAKNWAENGKEKFDEGKEKLSAAEQYARDVANGEKSGEEVVDCFGEKVASVLPYKPTVVAIFLVLLGVGIYTLLLVTTAVEVTDFEIVTTLIYLAISFMDLLRERLIFLTDNNLVYHEIMGRQFLTQPRELTMAWLWIPAAYCTGHSQTFQRVTVEMLLTAGMLVFTMIDNNSFKEGNDTGLEPEVLGTLVLLWGCFIVLPTVYVCLKGSTLNQMEPLKTPPKFKKFESFFIMFGLLKEAVKGNMPENLDELKAMAERLGDKDALEKLAAGKWDAAKDKLKDVTNVNSMGEAVTKGQEAYEGGKQTYDAGRRASQGRLTGESYEETQARFGVTGSNFGSPEGITVTGGVVVAGANMGPGMGVGPGMGESKADLARHAAHLDGVHGLATEADGERIHTNDGYEGVEAVNAGSEPRSWKALVMPLVGMLAALASALIYHGADTDYWVWGEGDEAVDLNDRMEKAAKILMVQAWLVLAQLAAAAFKDVDLEFRMKELMLEFNTSSVTKEQYEEATSEPTGILEGLWNALSSPFKHCKVEYYPEERNDRESGQPHPHWQNRKDVRDHHDPELTDIIMVRKWVGLVWLTAVLANVAKFAVTARGAFFAWNAPDENGFVMWYVWLEFGLIVGFIWIFWFISTDIQIRNPYLRSNYVVGPTLPEPEPPVAREIVIPDPPPASPGPRPLPLYLPGGASGFQPLPGYVNGGFEERDNGGAPPPLYISNPGTFGFPASLDGLQPLPGYRPAGNQNPQPPSFPPPGAFPGAPPGAPGGFGFFPN